jgi:hypothetical protein
VFPTPAPEAVAEVYGSYPETTRANLLRLRHLIFDVAEETPGVQSLVETLRWGQPSFVTGSGVGSTVRIDARPDNQSGDYAIYFICSTDLMDQFRTMFGEVFEYDGDRALVFENGDAVPEDQLRECVAMALTYHLRKSNRIPGLASPLSTAPPTPSGATATGSRRIRAANSAKGDLVERDAPIV